MKNLIKKLRRAAKPLLAAAALACGFGHAEAQIVYPRIITLGPITITNASTANSGDFTNTTINLTTNLLAVFPYAHDLTVETIVTSGAGVVSTNTGGLTNSFVLSLDGTNVANVGPAAWTTTNSIPGTTTTTNRNIVVISKSSWDGCTALQWTSCKGAALGTNVHPITVTIRLGQTP
jgi:hypothetical protein